MGNCYSNKIMNINEDIKSIDSAPIMDLWFLGNIPLRRVGSSMSTLESIDENYEIEFKSVHPLPNNITTTNNIVKTVSLSVKVPTKKKRNC